MPVMPEPEIEFHCNKCGNGVEVGENIPDRYEDLCYPCYWDMLTREGI